MNDGSGASFNVTPTNDVYISHGANIELFLMFGAWPSTHSNKTIVRFFLVHTKYLSDVKNRTILAIFYK